MKPLSPAYSLAYASLFVGGNNAEVCLSIFGISQLTYALACYMKLFILFYK